MKPAPESLRRTLLDASLSLITAEGLEGFSMREVARRAGVSHQAPYHHFPDREAIMAAIVAEGFQRLRDDSLAALVNVDDPHARLTAIGKAYVQFAHDHPAHFKLMFRSELVHEERHEEAKACAQGAFGVLMSVAGEAQTARGKPADGTLALMAWSLVHGVATLMLEGKLERHFGAQDESLIAAFGVIEKMEGLLRR